MADPVLIRLIEAQRRANAELEAYLLDGDAPAELEDDWVPLKDAEREFGRSNDTLRRWASQEGLGQLRDGRWHLSRSAVRKYRLG